MSRLTKEAVFTAIEELTKNGTEATVIALHKHLGKGSFSTISKYLNEYREQHAVEVEQAEQAAIPTVEGLGVPTEIRKQAVEAAESQLATLYASIEKTFLSSKLKIEEECDDRVSQVRSELAKQTDDYNAVVAVSDEQEQQIESLEIELDKAATALAESEKRNADQAAKITKLEILAGEAEKRSVQQEKRVDDAREALAAAKTDCAVTQQALDSANLSKAALERELKEAAQRERDLIKRGSSLETTVKSKDNELKSINDNLNSYIATERDLENQLRDAGARENKLKKQNQQYQQQLKVAEAEAKTK